jgi:hypothetical protein
MERIRNTNMISGRSILLFTVTSLSLLLVFHLLGITEMFKGVVVLGTTGPFARDNNNTAKPSILYSKLDGKAVVVLRGATVIDGTGSVPKPHAVVIVNSNKIVDVLTNDNKYYDYYSHQLVNVLNLTGKYIIPGLFDMHAHVAGVLKNSYNQTKSENMLHMLLANGITTIRNPGGPTEQSVALKENVTIGKIKGPRIFTAGRLINGPQIPIPFVEKQVKTEQEVRQQVRARK